MHRLLAAHEAETATKSLGASYHAAHATEPLLIIEIRSRYSVSLSRLVTIDEPEVLRIHTAILSKIVKIRIYLNDKNRSANTLGRYIS